MRLRLKTMDPEPAVDEATVHHGAMRPDPADERLLSLDATDEGEEAAHAPLFSLDLFATPTDALRVVVTRHQAEGSSIPIATVEGQSLADLHRRLYAIDPADSETLDLRRHGAEPVDEQAALLDFAARRARSRRIYAALIDAALAQPSD